MPKNRQNQLFLPQFLFFLKIYTLGSIFRLFWILGHQKWFFRISREISGFRAKFRAKFGGILSQKKTVIRSYLAKFSKKSYSVKNIEKLHRNVIQKVPLGLSTPLVARAIVIFQDFARNRRFRAKFRAKKSRMICQKKTVIRPYLAKFSKKSNSVKKIEKMCPNAIQKVPLGLRAPLVARAIDLDFFLCRTRPSIRRPPCQLIRSFGPSLSWPSGLCRPPAWDQKTPIWLFNDPKMIPNDPQTI